MTRRPFIYLDANATEPLRPEARAAIVAAWDRVGNPSSIHADGRAARAMVDGARRGLGAMFGVEAGNVVFTSGGTEACALAIHALSRRSPGDEGPGLVLAAATEHDAVLRAQPTPDTVAVLSDGTVDLAALEHALRAAPTALVCVMLANNETGVLNPIPEVAALCHAHGAYLHVDAVQAAGRVFPNVERLGADSLAISAHKFGGPKGIGALLLAGGQTRALAPLVAGGGQEQGRRGGTQPVELIVGMAAAAEAARAQDWTRIAALRDRFEHAAMGAGAVVCGAAAPRLPNTTCLAVPGAAAQTQLIAMDMGGVGVSAGSACSSGKVARSHVLDAMGLDELAGQALRVSLPWSADETQIEHAIETYAAMVARLGRKAA